MKKISILFPIAIIIIYTSILAILFSPPAELYCADPLVAIDGKCECEEAGHWKFLQKDGTFECRPLDLDLPRGGVSGTIIEKEIDCSKYPQICDAIKGPKSPFPWK